MPVSKPTSGSNVRTGPWPDAASGDRDLLARLAQHDEAAFRLLLDRYLAPIVSIARRMLHDEAEAEDVAQETLLRLWRSSELVDVGPYGLLPWLRRVASNLCLDRLRASKRTLVTDDVPEVPDQARQLETLVERDRTNRINQAVQTLPDRQRLALTLFHHEGLSHIEIGKIMGVSDEAVESLLARARRHLKQMLESEWRGLLHDDQT